MEFKPSIEQIKQIEPTEHPIQETTVQTEQMKPIKQME